MQPTTPNKAPAMSHKASLQFALVCPANWAHLCSFYLLSSTHTGTANCADLVESAQRGPCFMFMLSLLPGK